MLTPTLSEADALIATVPLTVALFAGAVIDTLGAVLSGSGLFMVTVTAEDCPTLPEASYAFAVKVELPFASAVVSQL